MIEVIYNGYSVMSVYGLTQYDYGQRLRISDYHIADGTEIHFCQGNKAVTQYMSSNEAIIPDFMLQYIKEINVYVYICDLASGETVLKIILPITAREKPGDYITPDEPAYARLLPLGGKPGQVPIRTPTGYVWVDMVDGQETTELEIIKMMEELFGGV